MLRPCWRACWPHRKKYLWPLWSFGRFGSLVQGHLLPLDPFPYDRCCSPQFLAFSLQRFYDWGMEFHISPWIGNFPVPQGNSERNRWRGRRTGFPLKHKRKEGRKQLDINHQLCKGVEENDMNIFQIVLTFNQYAQIQWSSLVQGRNECGRIVEFAILT